MMIKTYPAIFHEEDGGYWVEFPEFKGGTEGDTLDEAMKEAQDFLASIVAYYIDESKALPLASDIRNLQVSDGFVTLIQADAAPYIRGNKTIRKNVTIPEWLAIRAEKENANFSQILSESLYKKYG